MGKPDHSNEKVERMSWNRADFQAHNDHRWRSIPGKLCVYCGQKAVLLDHVPSLYQVFKDLKTNYPMLKVPACWPCNSALGAFAGVDYQSRVARICEVTGDDIASFAQSYLPFVVLEDWALAVSQCRDIGAFLSLAHDCGEAAFEAQSEVLRKTLPLKAVRQGEPKAKAAGRRKPSRLTRKIADRAGRRPE